MKVARRPDPRWVHQLSIAMFVLIAHAAALAGQVQTAVLEGIVQDESGAIVVTAAVTLRDPQTNVTRTARTDVQGMFRFADVLVGTYEVRVEDPGFAPYAHAGVTLAIGQTARLTVVLQPAGVVETVAVSAQPPPLDWRQTSISTVVDTERIAELPVRTRNYLEFVLLAPGVTRAASQPPAGAVTSILPASGFSFAGLRPRSNTLTIDGIDNTDEFTGSSRTELSLEIVREFQVVTSGWSAERGGGSAGAINVVTKSGANTRHGDAFLFAQSGIFNARPKIEETLGQDPSLWRFRGGLAIGGPLAKDRAFYYAAAEREGARERTASDIDPAIAVSIGAALAATPLPEIGTRELTIGPFSTARTETEWSSKITHALAGRGSLVGALAGSQSRDAHDAFNHSGLSDRSARGTGETRDVAVTGSWNAALSASTANELRGQVATRRQTFEANDLRGPGVAISGVADFGPAYVGDSRHEQRYIEVGNTTVHSRGRHVFKAGVFLKHVAVAGRVADGIRRLYTFRSLDAFFAGRPDSIRSISEEANLDFAIVRGGAFIQDHWTPSPGLTVDAGARFDRAAFPASLGMTNRQIGPRMGVAWTPAADWVIRGGIGMFADRVVLASLERPWIAARHGVVERITDGVGFGAPSVYTVKRGTWKPSSRQASLGVERLLSTNLTAAVNYLFVSGHDLPRTINVNLPPPTILTRENAASLGVDAPVPQQLGRAVFGPERLNAAWDGIFELQPTAASTYHGVTLSLNRRLANEIEWSAAYTWSHARDSASDFDEQPQNPYALADEWADSRYDQRHRFVASALFDLPIGDEDDRPSGGRQSAWVRAFSHIELAPILTLGTGTPLNVVTGADDNRTRAFPFTSRPLGMRRNAGRLPASATLDLRILKYFDIKPHGKLDIVVEAFNLLNRSNVTQLNTVFGPFLTPLQTFGRPIEASAARQIQFSIDFEF